MITGIEALACGVLAVPTAVMEHVVRVESSLNPYAIGVVGGRLERQPSSIEEAVATVRMLEEGGFNYSVGLAQINRVNFQRFELDAPEKAFDACTNVTVGAAILAECLQRTDGRWGDAFSCYYSGNSRTGYEHGYVQKVFASMGAPAPAAPIAVVPSGAAAAAPDSRQARISAPEAHRATSIAAAGGDRAAPFVGVGDSSALGDQAADPTPSEHLGYAPLQDVQGPDPTVEQQAPEAEFMAAMRSSAAISATAASAEANAPTGPAPTAPSPSPGPAEDAESATSKQHTKDAVPDGARVF